MNTETIDLIIEKYPKIQSQRKTLEAMQAGTYCSHRTWGIGRIHSYDEIQNKIIIDFEEENKIGHAMDPVFCLEKLNILSEENILVRHKTSPQTIVLLIQDNPTDLIVEILKQCNNNAATSIEIERYLFSLIGKIKYKKWWSETKKLLIKDPRIAVPEKKTGFYLLRQEPIKAEKEVLEKFYGTQSIKKQILLAQKLLDLSVTHEDIKEQLPDILQVLTEGIKNPKQLNPGQKLHGIWIRNDLARFIHKDPETLEPTSVSIIEDNLISLPIVAEMIPANYYKRFLELIYRSQPEKWEKFTFDLLRASKGRLITETVVFLIGKGVTQKLEQTLKRWLNEQTLKEPLLYWIIKSRHSPRFSKMLNALISTKLMSSILYAIENEALQNTTTRRIPLAELLCEDDEIISELLAEATTEKASDLATILILNQGFEELAKKSLLARFIRLFPTIQSLVKGKDNAKEKNTPEYIIVSKESYQARKKEYDILVKEKIVENKKAIAIAREHGDLAENSEYKMARQDQETLFSRKRQLENELQFAQQTDFQDALTDTVGIGSVVELHIHSTKKTVSYAILGAWDSNPQKNILSYKTPLAQALLSKKKEETVTTHIDGTKEHWTIRNILRYVELAINK
jgi:transcription elongation GreA/GreB family factor/transcription elongation factor GreA-like protein